MFFKNGSRKGSLSKWWFINHQKWKREPTNNKSHKETRVFKHENKSITNLYEKRFRSISMPKNGSRKGNLSEWWTINHQIRKPEPTNNNNHKEKRVSKHKKQKQNQRIRKGASINNYNQHFPIMVLGKRICLNVELSITRNENPNQPITKTTRRRVFLNMKTKA